MKNLGEAQDILKIKILWDSKNKKIALSQTTYIDKFLVKYVMQDSKKGLLSFKHGVLISLDQCPKVYLRKKKHMKVVFYSSIMGRAMYEMLCTKLDICFIVKMTSRYQSNLRPKHWIVVKHILKYLRKTRKYMLVYHSDELVLIRYIDPNFQLNKDSHRFTFGFMFTLGGVIVSWRNVKQSYITNFTTETKFVANFEATKETIQIKKFLMRLRVVPFIVLCSWYFVIIVG